MATRIGGFIESTYSEEEKVGKIFSEDFSLSQYDALLPDFQQQCTWITPNEEIEIQGFKINRGNIYVGKKFIFDKKYGPRYAIPENKELFASIINPELPISTILGPINHFHSYNDMSPYLRYRYLAWLAGNITDEEVETEIILMHLLGLKLRMFFDSSTTEAERQSILNEVVGYRRKFDKINNLELYQQFIDFIDNAVTKYFPKRLLEFTTEDERCEMKMIRTITMQEMMPADGILKEKDVYDYAQRWLYGHSRITDEYKNLAWDIFKESYRHPIKVAMHVSPQIQSYSLNGLTSTCNYTPEPMEAYAQITATPFNRWEVEREIYWAYRNVYRAFRGYNTALRLNGGKINLEAIFELPKQVDISKKEKVKDFIDFLEIKTADDEVATLSTNEILNFWEYKIDKKPLPKRIIDSVLNAFDRLGYGFEPDYRVHKTRFKADEPCIIFSKKRKTPIKIDEEYLQCQAMAKMGILMAQADGAMHKAEKEFISEYIGKRLQDATKRKYIKANLEFLGFSKQKFLGLKSYPAYFDAIEIENLYLFLIRLAIVDGEINLPEIEVVKKIMAYFDKDCRDIHSVIHRIYTEGSETPFTIFKESTEKKFLIPPKSDYLPVFVMDDKRLSAIEKDTISSQKMLSTIFSEDEATPEEATPKNRENRTEEILKRLLEKESWSRDEVEKICKGYDIAVGAALEEINDYSYDKIDDAVLEDEGETIYVTIDYKDSLL